MPEQIDTPAVQPAPEGETPASEVIGTPEDSSTPSSEPQVPETPPVDPAQVDKLQKDLNKLQQELNLRRNREKEIERQAYEKTGNLEEAYKSLQEELTQIKQQQEADAAAKQVEGLREDVLKDYPESVQKMAKDLNLYWDEAENETDARNQLKQKLDVLAQQTPAQTTPEQPAPVINPNNPPSTLNGRTLEEVVNDPSVSVAELRDMLPKAEPR